MKCFTKVTEDEQKELIDKMNKFDTKDTQDTFLQSLMEHRNSRRHRPRVKDLQLARPKTYSFSFFVTPNGKKIKVCKKAFINLHGSTKKTVERIQRLLTANKIPKDYRGTSAGSRHNVISEDIRTVIHTFLNSFSPKDIHFSCSNSKKNTTGFLNVKVMHGLFIEKYPEYNEKIKYDFFLKLFHENFNVLEPRLMCEISVKEEK